MLFFLVGLGTEKYMCHIPQKFKKIKKYFLVPVVLVSSTTTKLHHMQLAPTVRASWIIILVLQESQHLPCNASLPIGLSQVLATARLARLQLTVIVWYSSLASAKIQERSTPLLDLEYNQRHCHHTSSKFSIPRASFLSFVWLKSIPFYSTKMKVVPPLIFVHDSKS
jgi:hypothetical protein